MKRKLMVLLIALMVAMLVVSPVVAKGSGATGPDGWVDGTPPGWANVPGWGGSGN